MVNVNVPLRESLFFRLEKPVFLLSLISKHEMVRMELIMADGSFLTVRQHQQQTQILLRLKSKKVFFRFFPHAEFCRWAKKQAWLKNINQACFQNQYTTSAQMGWWSDRNRPPPKEESSITDRFVLNSSETKIKSILCSSIFLFFPYSWDVDGPPFFFKAAFHVSVNG